MNQTFEHTETINERAKSYSISTGSQPRVLRVSREIYRRLVQLRALACCIGDFVVGCVPVVEIETNAGKLRIVIDELLEANAFQIE